MKIHRIKRMRGGVHSAEPKTGRHYVIYAVVLREHQERVKIGRTTSWNQRRRAYDNWNFANGDGIMAWAAYSITEMYVDLEALEAACLGAVNKPLVSGREWFRGSLSDAKGAIEQVLFDADLSSIRLDDVEPDYFSEVIQMKREDNG